MLFTVAIPTYNNADTISKAINSCLKIEFEGEYEILIVNNASTDVTKQVLQKFEKEKKIRVIENKITVDLFENHNVCFREAKGDYVIFCHSDDELKKDSLKILKKKLEERNYPEKYIVWGQSMFRDFYSFLKFFNINYNMIISGERAIQVFSIPNGLTPSGTCYSRKSILEIGGFYKMLSRTTPNDWTIMLNAALNEFEFEMVDRLLFIRKFASTAVDRNNKKIKLDIFDAFEEFLKHQSEENKKNIRVNLKNSTNYRGYDLLCKFFHLNLNEKIIYILKLGYASPKELIKFLLKNRGIN